MLEHGSDQGTFVRVACDGESVASFIPIAQAAEVSAYAATIAKEIPLERQLATFVHMAAFMRDQTAGRDAAVEAVISEAFPEHVQDMAFTVILFVFGLLAKRADLASRLDEALLQGGYVIDIHVSDDIAGVRFTGCASQFETHFAIAEMDDATAIFH